MTSKAIPMPTEMERLEAEIEVLDRENIWLRSSVISMLNCIRAERKPTLDQLAEICEHTLKRPR